jgi:hypothetical protein
LISTAIKGYNQRSTADLILIRMFVHTGCLLNSIANEERIYETKIYIISFRLFLRSTFIIFYWSYDTYIRHTIRWNRVKSIIHIRMFILFLSFFTYMLVSFILLAFPFSSFFFDVLTQIFFQPSNWPWYKYLLSLHMNLSTYILCALSFDFIKSQLFTTSFYHSLSDSCPSNTILETSIVAFTEKGSWYWCCLSVLTLFWRIYSYSS